ncbi:TPA: phage tail spike protein, partial [Streptococcus suis]
MLYLLDKDVKTVKWNGIPLHEASSAIVKEEVNGDFVLTVRFPITDSGIYQLIKEDMLIKAPVPVLGAQLFRIKKPIENDDSLDITAYHITDDVMQRSINPLSVVGQGCAMALSQMVQNSKTDLGTFSFTSDIMDSRTFNTTDAETLYSVLLDGKHSIVGTWEGEIVRDNFALTIKRSRGADRGVVITTHKNLKSYQRTKNSQSVVTRIHAKSTFKPDGAEDEVTLRVTVDSPLIGNYPYINEKDYENNNAKTVDELRKWAEAKFKNEGIDKVSDAIEIEAYELDGQVIHLGDTVNIKSRKHNVDIHKKAIAYEYNALTEEYISITFDDTPGVGGSGVSSGVSNAADVILNANQNAQEVAIERAVRNANQAFDAEFEKRVEEINDGIEQAQAEAERYADAIKQEIDTEIAQVNQSMQVQSEEHDRQVADILSKTQSIESLANQAKSDAANAIARANQVKTEAIADARAQVATVSQALNAAKTELQSAIASADQKARDSQASATALRNDLNLQASKILEQARAQTALTSRVTSVETLADGTRSTVAELSRTMQEATQNIASVTSRTRTVEDTLSQTRTQYEALTQTVNTQTGQIDSINRKTADLQSGIDGVTERFESLRVGGTNLFKNSDFSQGEKNWHKLPEIHNEATGKYVRLPAHLWKMAQFVEVEQGEDYVISLYAKKISESSSSPRLNIKFDSLHNEDTDYVEITKTDWKRFIFKFRAKKSGKELVYFLNRNGIEVDIKNIKMEKGLLATDWSPAPEDYRSEIATYRRTAEESSAELSRQIQLADGKAVEAKTYAQQTAEGFKTRLESLETYKNEEGTRASQYLTASRTETAKQLSAERAAIATNYVAKSTYDENVRGTTLKLNEIKTTADTAKQNLATYQNTVDRKLEELTTSTQTLDGKINTASAKVDTVAGQIRTEISEVEGKIPTEVGGQNLLLNSSDFVGWTKYGSGATIADSGYNNSKAVVTADASYNGYYANNTKCLPLELNTNYVTSCWVFVRKRPTSCFIGFNNVRISNLNDVSLNKWVRVSKVFNTGASTSAYTSNGVFYLIASGGDVLFSAPKLETGTIPTDYSVAQRDIINELSSVKTTITQTASGVEQLSTSLTTTDSKVTTAEAKIRQLISDVSSKVSQTDYNTLTGRVDSAETAITQNATEISKRLTSTQVESAITSKGYQTKSDVDSNITGRGYITSGALQPYALSTTVQNLVQETADSFSRTISRVENKIPTKIGVTNLLGGTSSDWKTIRVTRFNGLIKSYNPQEWALLNIKTGDSVTFSVDVKTTSGKKLRSRISFYGPNTHYYSKTFVVNGEGRLSVTGVVPDGITSVQLSVDAKLTMTTNTGVTDESCRREKLEIGAIPTDWSPAPEDFATVTALHSVRDTVDSHTRTIGAVGTAGSILDNISKVTQTAAGLVQEVSGTNGLKTQVSQLAG